MAFEISWYVERRVIFARYYDEITVEELKEATAIIYDYLDATEPPAYLLVDSSQVTRHPYSLAVLKQALGKDHHPHISWTINVTPSKGARMLSGMLHQLARMQSKHVTSLEEGLEFLQRLDKTLPDLSQTPPIPYTTPKTT